MTEKKDVFKCIGINMKKKEKIQMGNSEISYISK